jgi:hypothetical protein
MEAVLDVYQETFDDQHPLICMDEVVVALVAYPASFGPGC